MKDGKVTLMRPLTVDSASVFSTTAQSTVWWKQAGRACEHSLLGLGDRVRVIDQPVALTTTS